MGASLTFSTFQRDMSLLGSNRVRYVLSPNLPFSQEYPFFVVVVGSKNVGSSNWTVFTCMKKAYQHAV